MSGPLPGSRALGNGHIAPFYHVRALRAARQAMGAALGVDAFAAADAELTAVEALTAAWAARLRDRVDRYAKLYDAEPWTPTPRPDAVQAVKQLAGLKAAMWDVGRALRELVGVPPENIAAWRIVQMLVDVYVASEDLRMGAKRRKADGSPRMRRPLGEACRRVGVSEDALLNQINRARQRAGQTKEEAV